MAIPRLTNFNQGEPMVSETLPLFQYDLVLVAWSS